MKVTKRPSGSQTPPRKQTRSLLVLAIIIIGFTVASAGLIIPNVTSDYVVGGRGAVTLLTTMERTPHNAAVRGAPFKDEQGRTVSLEDFRGKVVVLNFWATWCPPCVREMPGLDQLQASLGGPHFAVVAVSTDRMTMRDVKEFADDQGWLNLPLYHDSDKALSEAMQVGGLPTSFILDGTGRLIGQHVGMIDWTHAPLVSDLRKRVEALAAAGSGG
ncbi:redoxin domain-containing protein [Rhodospira trueperi]|uniref:Thiol-disulfide isomerase or thioredoxin n=1 Tax=Rhodospira trueperi TaxID=69960 RepID=A0A1G7DG55_9PROT|nr:TlpA disulfide reductase family protein [Rhodospira trueperi]SDE50578.1 Thiol-disulfide isomerase or thioredoxin [Rhodospira trueperi]